MQWMKWLGSKAQSLLTFAAVITLAGCSFGKGDTKGYVGGPGGGAAGRVALVGIQPAQQKVSVKEGGQVEVVLHFDRPLPKATTLDWVIKGGESDFEDASGTLSLDQGSRQAKVRVHALDDGIYEGDEHFKVQWVGDPSVFSASVEMALTVIEASYEPVVSFATSRQDVATGETSPVEIEVLLSSASVHTTTVTLETSGAAKASGVDYFLSPFEEVTFLPGETSKKLLMTLMEGAPSSPLKDAVLKLGEIRHGVASVDSALQSHTVWIVDTSSASFSIRGVSGGMDESVSFFLKDGKVATVHWQEAPNASTYRAELLDASGNSFGCDPAEGLTGTSHTFAGCDLVEGESYQIHVQAQIEGTLEDAANKGVPFLVDSTPPASFDIMGITGGLDTTPDGFLAGGLHPTVHWTDAPDEFEYIVQILKSDHTVQCEPVRLAANHQAYSFSECQLELEKKYAAHVVARDEAGNERAASNSPYEFEVITVPSGFVILGVTGGTADQTPDDEMTDGDDVVLHWEDAAGAKRYEVTIYENNGTAVRCPTHEILDPDLSHHTFENCPLELHSQYNAVVVAYDSEGNAYPAANSPFQFRHKVGLYISGTGGSYYRGIPITRCGGASGDVCNSASPYEVYGALEEPQIRVSNAGVITARQWVSGPPSTTNGVLEVVAQKLWLDPGSLLTMSGKGYSAGHGPGQGPSVSSTLQGGSGGAYGGYSGFTSALAAAPNGLALTADSLGSPGGSNTFSSCPAEGGRGGGAVRVQAQTVFLNGRIEADGASGSSQSCTSANRSTSGGGSGGSVRLLVDTIRGSSGNIRVNGGSGGSITSGNTSYAGSGSGGRILLTYKEDLYVGTVDTLTFQAFGGTQVNSRAGAAGTVVLVNENQSETRLVVDNGPHQHRQGVETPVPYGEAIDFWETRNNGTLIIEQGKTFELYSSDISYRLVAEGEFTLPGGGQDLVLSSGGYLEWRKSTPLELRDLEIKPGAVLTHSYNSESLNYALPVKVQNLDLLGHINVSGRGYRAGAGLGSAALTAGGSYGGMGGQGNTETSKNPYGSIKAPHELGSGGSGAAGGGAVLLEVSNDFLLMGNIFANGSSASSGGGGAGGTVNISAGRIYGTGSVIQASGGNGASNSGGGSGGRIALALAQDTYLPAGVLALQMEAFGGTGSHRDGAAGTVFVVNTTTDNHGHLMVRNSTRTYNEDTTTLLQGAEEFDSISSDSTGTLHIAPGVVLPLPSTTIHHRMVVEGDFALPGVHDDLIIAGGGYLEWRKNDPLALRDLTIESGGVLTHSHNSSGAMDYYLEVDAQNLTVRGEITASGRGYTSGTGSGGGITTSSAAPGGSYGGRGGWGATSPGKDAYGDLKNPSDMGSGGGRTNSSSSVGGQGGGLIRLTVADTFEHYGAIRANGSSGTSSAGGGSGGGVFIDAGNVLGIGALIEVMGGNGQGSGGNGSGGRVAIYYGADGYTGGVENMVVRTSGGTISNSSSGAGGTIFFRNTSETASQGRLIVDNGGLFHAQGVETPLPLGVPLDHYSTRSNGTFILPAGESFQLQSDVIDYRVVIEGEYSLPGGPTQLTIASGGRLEWRRNSKITLDTLIIESGGVLTHSYNASGPDYILDIEVDSFVLNGTIDVDHRGYGPREGPGATTGSGGASYGGQGGGASLYGMSPSTYGEIREPNSLGSGTGSGRGGGLVRLNVEQTANINGMISARGESFSGSCSGGGSGGTIYLEADTITGTTGVLRARGGSTSTSSCGGGGGGRIALHYNHDSFGTNGLSELTLEAHGGAGAYYGAAGTIFLMHNGEDDLGRLLVKNGAAPTSEWTTTFLPDEGKFDSLETDSGTSLEIRQGEVFHFPSATVDYRLVLGGEFTLPGGGKDLLVASGGSLELRKTDPLVLDKLTVAAGASLTHSSNFGTHAYSLNLDVGEFVLDGNINLTGKGFQIRSGPGTPTAGRLGGAGHAGFGGRGTYQRDSQGLPYGNPRDPTDLGSGGGSNSGSCTTGRGGGVALIEATSFVLNGSISASGTSGSSGNLSPTCTGGSGGSVNIETDLFSGNTGSIYARGGNSPTTATGSGSGGRVALIYTTENYIGGLSQLLIDARGGTTNNSSQVGAAGTIYIRDDGAGQDKLIVNNFSNPFRRHVNTALLDDYQYGAYEISPTAGLFIPEGQVIDFWSSRLDFPLEVEGVVNWPANLTLGSNAYLDWVRAVDPLLPEPIEVTNLTLESGSRITHAPNEDTDTMLYFLDFAISGDLVMYPGAQIDVSAMGYSAEKGPGAGTPNSNSPSGASYGGLGGEGNNETLPPPVYGDAISPYNLGSGGGGANGSSGGGFVRLQIGGNFHFEGEILARGGGVTDTGRGAGSGGAIHVITHSLSGSMGLMDATGGSSLPKDLPDSTGGSGGGGRVSLSYSVDAYVGAIGSTNGLNILAEGGESRADRMGEAGTVTVQNAP